MNLHYDRTELDISAQCSLPQALQALLCLGSPYRYLKTHPAEHRHVFSLLERVKSEYRHARTDAACADLHKTLNAIYDYQISAASAASQFDPVLMEIMLELESEWISYERSRVPKFEGPKEPGAFCAWLKCYILTHESSDHRIYRYLMQEGSLSDMSYFFSQEVTIDPRFDDLIALGQVGLQDRDVKLELAANFWDEMGTGNPREVHTTLFQRLYKELNIMGPDETFADVLSKASWQALACGNVLLYAVLHRRNFPCALGALGTVEIVSPLRFAKLVAGFERIGISNSAREYHQAHIKIDARHSYGWLHNAIHPTVRDVPQSKQDIFSGACFRLHTSRDYCEHIAERFGI